MIPLDEALEATLSRAWALPAETLPLQEAAGRFLAEDLVAASDSPLFGMVTSSSPSTVRPQTVSGS